MRSENYRLESHETENMAIKMQMSKTDFFIHFFSSSFCFWLRSQYVVGPYRFVRWLREDVLIADSSHPEKIPPPRITLFNNGSLQVRNVKRNDTAEYLCEVLTDSTGLESQLHAIEVQCKQPIWHRLIFPTENLFWFPSTENRSTASNVTAKWTNRSEVGHRIRGRLRGDRDSAADNHVAIEGTFWPFGAKFSPSFDRSS